ASRLIRAARQISATRTGATGEAPPARLLTTAVTAGSAAYAPSCLDRIVLVVDVFFVVEVVILVVVGVLVEVVFVVEVVYAVVVILVVYGVVVLVVLIILVIVIVHGV